jgi:DNA-binding NtrC family response regulator
MLTDGPVLTERDIQASIRPVIVVNQPLNGHKARESEDALSSLERQHIMKVIAQTGGNKARAARQLGLSRRALYRRLERHGLAEPSLRRES